MNNVGLTASKDSGDLLIAFVRALGSEWDHDEFLWRLASTVAELLELDDFVIYLREGRSLTQAAAVGIKAPDRRQLYDPITIPIGHAVVGDAAQRRQTVHIRDLSHTAGYVADHVDGQSELTVPVLFDDEVVAVFDSEGTEVNTFAEWQVEGLELFASVAAAQIVLWKEQRDERLRTEQARGLQAQALGTFAGTVAHDLNNILAVIELNAEVLRRHTTSSDRIQASLSDAVQKARRLTGRLLSLTTNGPLSPEIIDVATLLSEAAADVTLVDNIDITLTLEDDLPLLRADAVQIPQIVTNLMTNAVEAIGDCPGRITLSAHTEPGDPPAVVIQVTDDGPGIDGETIRRVFDPYFSTKPNGVGLGLASAYWAALQHDGKLECRSELGMGTTFVLRLPGHVGRVVESPPGPTPDAALKILVLEDDNLVAEGLTEVLRFCGHHTTWVQRGEQVAPAWSAAAAEGRPFDLALLDIRNELGEDGEFALRSLKSLAPGARAVAMSGYADGGLAETKRLGFASTIAKPFRVEELARALDEAMRADISRPGSPVPGDV